MATIDALAHYVNRFRKLRRDSKKGGAPHKPILLLAIIAQFERGEQSSSRIRISPDLVATFRDLWSAYVVTDHYCRFELPFFHMQSEPFWTLLALPGRTIPQTRSHSIRSFRGLLESVAYAQIDSELLKLLLVPESRAVLRIELLEKYFPHVSTDAMPELITLELFSEQQLAESAIEYRTKIAELQAKLKETDFEQEVFLRGAAFARSILKLYNQTCAVSGLRVDALGNVSMVDACHIVPFSESHDDTVSNGICLCPNLHRAFDRGLVAIDDSYRVLVSESFSESDSGYGIRQFAGKEIRLPKVEGYWPAIENLQRHRNITGW